MKGRIQITVSSDMMEAVGMIVEGGEEEITLELINEKLEEKGIKAGLQKEGMEGLATCENYQVPYVLAKGRKSGMLNEGHYDFYFDATEKEYRPQIRPDGSVDYSIQRELVQAGDKIAQYFPPSNGYFGYTVYATVIAPVAPKETIIDCGIGVEVRDHVYYATVSGEVTMKNDTLNVYEQLVIDKDAGNATGVIQYNGSIYVKGDVLSGVTMIADGNIKVDGVVEGANIEAGGDIVIKYGIHGAHRADIKAKGSLYTSFIEEAKVQTGENIYFASIINSNVYARECIESKTAIGRIVGGVAIAGNSIIVENAGNEAEISTKLCIENHQDRNLPCCKIQIENKFYPGVELRINDAKYLGRTRNTGEYHRIAGIIQRFNLGDFNEKDYLVSEEEICAKKTILLVDDEPMILKTFYGFLKDDYNVSAVNSAKDAFNFLEKKNPDLILLDFNMPNMNGGEMLEQMRKLTWKKYCNVPVIFVSAVTDRALILKCLMLYPQGYLMKPISKDNLLLAVKNFFEKPEEESVQVV